MKEIIVDILIVLVALGLVLSTFWIHDRGFAVLCAALSGFLIWLDW